MIEVLSPYATFLLGVAAFLRIILFFPNPMRAEIERFEGKTDLEIENEIGRDWDTDPGNALAETVGSFEYTLLVFLYTFVIDPLVVIIALTRNIGSQPISYAMLIAVAITASIWIRNIVLAVQANNGKPVDEAEMEHIVPASVIALADKIKLGHRTRLMIRRIFHALPFLYLWYLLLVVLDVLP